MEDNSFNFNNFEFSKELNKSNCSELSETKLNEQFDKIFNKKTTALSEMLCKIEEFTEVVDKVEKFKKISTEMLTEINAVREVHEESCSTINIAINKITEIATEKEDRISDLNVRNLILIDQLNKQYGEINAAYENIKQKNIQYEEQVSRFDAISKHYDEMLEKISKTLPVLNEIENKYSNHSQNFMIEKLIISISVVLSIFFLSILIIFIMLHNDN